MIREFHHSASDSKAMNKQLVVTGGKENEEIA
jgi:hypothetical protein